MLTGGVGSLELVVELGRVREVRSAMDWAQVRALAADGVSQTQIAARLGINRRTVKRLLEADAPPRYERAPAGSMLDPLEPVIGKLLADWPGLKDAQVQDGRDLKPTTDLRAVLKGVLKDHLRVDDKALADHIFPGSADVPPTADLMAVT